MNREQLKEWAEAIYINIDPTSPFAPLQQKAADFLQSLADLSEGEPETAEINDGYDLLVTKKNRDWHILQHAETKRKLDDAQRRINVAVKMIEINNSYEHTAWNSMLGIAYILTMPQPEFETFLENHPEYQPCVK